MKYPPVILNTNGLKNYIQGKLWFTYKDLDSFEKIKDSIEPGSLVSLYSQHKHFLGQGYFNSHSYYSLKLLTKKEISIDISFFKETFKLALEFRERFFPGESSFRLIHAEGDHLPGLIIDLFDKVGVIQIHTLGMERLKSIIIDALLQIRPLESIVLKNDFDKRKEEKLPLYVDFYLKEPQDPYPIEMDGIKFLIPIIKGQKTGFFLDQRENRRFLSRISHGFIIMDGFAYIGGFSFYALKGGAKRVYLLERSGYALDIALEIAKLNGWKDQVVPVEGDVFQLLKNPVAKANLLILDPPAFIKSKKDYFQGYKKYKELYSLGLQYFKAHNGFLFLFSCSHFLKLQELLLFLKESLSKCNFSAKIFQVFHQSPDHPINPCVEETEYLKGVALEFSHLHAPL
jgi:23S rRNA (cytosine1962-C5)-methyltransferase